MPGLRIGSSSLDRVGASAWTISILLNPKTSSELVIRTARIGTDKRRRQPGGVEKAACVSTEEGGEEYIGPFNVVLYPERKGADKKALDAEPLQLVWVMADIPERVSCDWKLALYELKGHNPPRSWSLPK